MARSGLDERTGRGRLAVRRGCGCAQPGRAPLQVEIVFPESQFVLFFDGVEVGPERLLGSEGDGFRILFDGLNPERILGAALLDGIGRYALDRAAAYANERAVWGVPIGAHQGIAHPLAGRRSRSSCRA